MYMSKSVHWTKWAVSLYVMILCLDVTKGVRINKLQVPEVTHIGNPVILDCDYSWEETKDDGIVVKWYFNEEKIPVYQWIATQKPQVLGEYFYILQNFMYRVTFKSLPASVYYVVEEKTAAGA
ncbi:hypothetical protein RI129_006298 [Pyrocoelia pectoralis]|uniref:Uncharacterized protein n=1 Tax=Pyrocoelia pectoralis TaxID=417401 RepID=A0AAN7VDW5_9COLE